MLQLLLGPRLRHMAEGLLLACVAGSLMVCFA